MRLLLSALLVALVALSGCDAVAPSETASAKQVHRFRIVGPSSVIAGSCDTFTIEDTYGNPQTGSNWQVQGDGYLTNSNAASAYVLATGPTTGHYTLKVTVQGSSVAKSVNVFPNPKNTAEC